MRRGSIYKTWSVEQLVEDIHSTPEWIYQLSALSFEYIITCMNRGSKYYSHCGGYVSSRVVLAPFLLEFFSCAPCTLEREGRSIGATASAKGEGERERVEL